MEHISCDVLVIGSGAAGLRAAIAAREAGAEVIVLSKAKTGKATCTGFSAGVMAGSCDEATHVKHSENTFAAGRGLNRPDLVEILVNEAPLRHCELVNWGIRAEFQNGYLFAKGSPPIMGEEIVRCLIRRNEEIGTRFLGGLLATNLMMEDDAAAVLAYAYASRKWLGISAEAVVCAAGGAAALYLRHDNPGRMLGDGCRLALEAGAVLQDMEFVQFYPLCLAEPGLPPMVIPPRLADRGRLTNTTGEEILEKYGIEERPAGERARDRLSRALFQEIHRREETVRLDLTGQPREVWTSDPFAHDVMHIFGERFGAFHRPVRVAPAAHHSMGGIQIDASGASSVPGLFAAGEAASGIHGANRMGGNALSDTLVFGARAGSSAAAWAHGSAGKGSQAMPRLETLAARWQNSSSPGKNIRERLRQIMWREGGLLRNREGLIRTAEDIRQIRSQIFPGAPGSCGDIREVVEVSSATRVAGLIIEAALRRSESRGAHFREDFPDQDDSNWRGHLQVHAKSAEEDTWEFVPD